MTEREQFAQPSKKWRIFTRWSPHGQLENRGRSNRTRRGRGGVGAALTLGRRRCVVRRMQTVGSSADQPVLWPNRKRLPLGSVRVNSRMPHASFLISVT
jgi:hypothetical protein